MRKLLILISLMFCWQVQASRLLEVEDYYSQKASDFIKLRYPKSAFSVYVKADAENSPQVRQPSSNRETLNLPYLDSVNAVDVGFWDRQDLSLSTLLTYLKSVVVTVDIDHDFSIEESEKFKEELFKHLKLSANFDRVDLNQRVWTRSSFWQQIRPFSLFVLPGLLMAFIALFFLFQTSINRLVKGLARPLGEIGKSAENVANSSQISQMGSGTSPVNRMDWSDNNLGNKDMEKAREDLLKLVPLFSHPSSDLLYTLNELGQRNPRAIGAIFKEIPVESLKALAVWAHGDWWRVALTEVSPMNKASIQYIDELRQLQIRQSLVEEKVNVETSRLKCILSRLNTKDFGPLLKGRSFTEASRLLRLLPQETMIAVGKYLYPGQWAELLLKEKDEKIKDASLKGFYEEAIKIRPLLSESQILEYFKDADLARLLDRSSTKDEREIYRALPDSSWLKQNRKPFYDIFQKEDRVLETLTSRLPLEIWALAIIDCDRQECEKIFRFFTDRQRFIMRNFKKKFESQPQDRESRILAKHQILQIADHLEKEISHQDSGKQNEMVA